MFFYLKNLFSNEFILNIGIKIIYLYSYCEILLNKYVPTLLVNNSIKETNKQGLHYYKDGVLLTGKKYNFDLLINITENTHNNKQISIRRVVKGIEAENYYTLTSYKFISFTINYLGDEYEIHLSNSKYTYYIVNNEIDASFIKYYLVNYYNIENIDNNIFSYSATILDENMNVVSFTENDKLILFYDTYKIKNLDKCK
jgi:hypothetical protein